MNAALQTLEAGFEPLAGPWLDAVLAVEQSAYAHPWSRRNFADALEAGYQAQLLLAGETLLGYFVAMKGVDEVHLLNITVTPAHQRCGWGLVMLDALAIWARGQQAHSLWLEVRVGNPRALAVYERFGFHAVGQRRDYYPAGHGQREDAIVMSRLL